MSYVPDETVLGNPGFFGFIGKAIKSVVGVAGSIVGISQKAAAPAPTQVVVQAPAPAAVGATPKWLLPVAIGGGALVLVLLVSSMSRPR